MLYLTMSCDLSDYCLQVSMPVITAGIEGARMRVLMETQTLLCLKLTAYEDIL